MLGSKTLVYAGNARQKVGEVTSYFRTPGMSLLDWQNNSDCGRAGRAGGHNPPPFGLRAEPANTGTPPLPVGCSHIHPKTACREVRERQWHSAAPVSAPASAGAGRFPLGSGTRGSRRDQVLLSLPQNRRKHWVFAGFLFACVARLCGSRWFKVRLFAPGFIRSQPFPSPPPPKTHPASPFRALPGVLRFFILF